MFAVGSRQFAVGSRQFAVGSGQFGYQPIVPFFLG